VTGAASVGGRERPRLFAALLLPEPTVRGVVDWQRDVLDHVRDIRVVPPANLHVTLAFLGPRPADDVAPIVAELRAAAAEADRPVLTVRRYRETRSVGMLALDDAAGHAIALAANVHRRLEGIGVYEPERRRWLPHLTVVRFRRPPRLDPALPELGEISPSEAAVYHSVLRPTGAQYEVVESVPLGS
jgi:RNA 2',3'-cyclic 3'-phosphodiesterase